MALPQTKQGLEDAGYVFDGESTCRGCGVPIEWWITPNDKKMPMIVKEVKKSSGVFAPGVALIRVPHWSDCPEATSFRRK